MWVGTIDIFSDDLAQTEVKKGVKSGNAQFVQVSSVLTMSLTTRLASSPHLRCTRSMIISYVLPYHINAVLTHFVLQIYTAHISSFDAESAKWVPYSGLKDLQLEFNPHICTALKPPPGNPGYRVTFRAPHGVFEFVLDHKRKGYVSLLLVRVRFPNILYRFS